ncbi:MAG: hypothetical protein GEU83_02970 [Pseudonocardiaceae bacterium]|nr:hypothetical protein [Pseudonocardiaceae bacterium]
MDRAVRRAVLERLTGPDDMQTGTAPSAPLARTQLRRIVEGWRDLLTGHQPDSKGRCPMCSGLLRRRRWPCQVWITAHQQLIGEGQAEKQSAAVPRGPARPQRDVEIIARGADGRRREPERAATPMRTQVHPVLPAQVQLDSARIHRAAVIERESTMPRPLLSHRPRG